MNEYIVEKEFKPGFDRLHNKSNRSSVTIKRLGAEVIGYEVFDETRNKLLPLLWNNNRDDLPFNGAWKNHATVLFPIVGGIKNNKSQLGKQKITTPCGHGFARISTFDVAGQNTEDCAEITYRLISNNKTRQYYPFDFCFDLTYTLKEKNLSAKFSITNTGKDEMCCSFGWHPGFDTELGLGGKREDWQIIFNKGDYKKYHMLIGENSFLTGKTSILQLDGPMAWTDDDLYYTLAMEIEKTENRTCRLYNPILNYGINMHFQDFPHFGIWAKRNQQYICMEPWQGMDDHDQQEPFDKKVGIYKLATGENVIKSATIEPISSS